MSPGGLRPVTGARPWKVLPRLRCRSLYFLARDRYASLRGRHVHPSIEGIAAVPPSEGGRTPPLDRAECLETDLFNCGAHDDFAREGRGYGEEEDWEAWHGDHRPDGCRCDRGEPIDGSGGNAASNGQLERSCSGSGCRDLTRVGQ